MEVTISIQSSTEDSVNLLTIQSVEESVSEVLVTVISPIGEQKIYILIETLKKAVSLISGIEN